MIAKIDGEPLRQSDIDYAIASLPEHRRAALEDTAARKEFIRQVVEGRVVAVDAHRRFGSADKEENLAELTRRELCRYTQNVVIAKRLGISEPELSRWIGEHRSEFGADSALPTAQLEQRAAEMIRLKEGNLPEFYREHSPLWTLPGRVEISAIETGSLAKIRKAQAALQRGESFSSVASQISEHHTATRGGYFGWIAENEGHFLVSQYPELRALLFGERSLGAGKTTAVLSATNPEKHLIVRIDSSDPRRLPAFEEVEANVRSAYLYHVRKREFDARHEELKKIYRIELLQRSDSQAPLRPEEVLATMGKKDWINGEQVIQLREEYTGKAAPSDSAVLNLLVFWRLWELYGIDLGIDRSEGFQHFKADYHSAFWMKMGVDSVIQQGFGLLPDEQQKVMDAHPELFVARDARSALADAALLAKGDWEELRVEWLLFPERYGADSAVAFGENFPSLFSGARRALDEGVRRRYLAELERSVGVRWIDTTWSPVLFRTPSEAADVAAALLKTRRPVEAVSLLTQALAVFPSPEPKRDTLTYLLGRSWMDAGRPNEAIRAFFRYAALYPQGSDFCRALFISGFIIENDLKDSKNALAPLRRLIAECPDSELVRDAAYIVEDIACDHCKTAEFLKTLEAPSSSEVVTGEN